MSWGPAKRKGGVHRHEKEQTAGIVYVITIYSEGSFIAKTSGNRVTADHVVPTGGSLPT